MPVIELSLNVSVSEKLFMRWPCEQVGEASLLQRDLGSAAVITAGRKRAHRHVTPVATSQYTLPFTSNFVSDKMHQTSQHVLFIDLCSRSIIKGAVRRI